MTDWIHRKLKRRAHFYSENEVGQLQEVNVTGQSIRIVNVGQKIVWIDEGETLAPGEAKVYEDPTGHGMDFTLSISFIDNPSPPDVNIPVTHPGGMVYIEKLYRVH